MIALVVAFASSGRVGELPPSSGGPLEFAAGERGAAADGPLVGPRSEQIRAHLRVVGGVQLAGVFLCRLECGLDDGRLQRAHW